MRTNVVATSSHREHNETAGLCPNGFVSPHAMVGPKMSSRLAFPLVLSSLATLSCLGDPDPEPIPDGTPVSVPAVFKVSDDADLSLDAFVLGDGYELVGEAEGISLRLVVPDVEEPKGFQREADADGNPFTLEVTEDGETYTSDDLQRGEWFPHGDGVYTGFFAWGDRDGRLLYVGERVTLTFRCVFDEYTQLPEQTLIQGLCREQQIEMFAIEYSSPPEFGCPGQGESGVGEWELADCASIAAYSCTLNEGEGEDWYIVESACDELTPFHQEQTELWLECGDGLEPIGSGCDGG
jgi:hypothetical protein